MNMATNIQALLAWDQAPQVHTRCARLDQDYVPTIAYSHLSVGELMAHIEDGQAAALDVYRYVERMENTSLMGLDRDALRDIYVTLELLLDDVYDVFGDLDKCYNLLFSAKTQADSAVVPDKLVRTTIHYVLERLKHDVTLPLATAFLAMDHTHVTLRLIDDLGILLDYRPKLKEQPLVVRIDDEVKRFYPLEISGWTASEVRAVLAEQDFPCCADVEVRLGTHRLDTP